MKKILLQIVIFSSLVVIGFVCASVKEQTDQVNLIERVEVFNNGEISTEATFFLLKECSPDVNFKEMPDYTDIKIFLPDVKLGSGIDRDQIFLALNNLGLVKYLAIDFGKKKIKVGSAIKEKMGVLLNLRFYHDKAFVKFIGIDRRRFKLEIFSKEELRRISKSVDGPLLLALNSNSILPSGLAKKKNKQNYRIVIDAGHGGDFEGAKSNGLVEKNIVLDIAQKTKALLLREGFKAFLTRDRDVEISLLNRSKMAERLNCDLFVSIHANSSAFSPNAKGIETYYGNLIDDGGFELLFTNAGKGYNPGNIAALLNRRKTLLSSELAKSIQISLLNLLHNNNVKAVDRGVKKQSFLVLVRGGFTSVLVEVGFITNKEEARLLEDKKYRTLIACGITQGIKNFLKQ